MGSEMRSPHRIAIAGFGNVGQAVAQLIADGHPSAAGVVITGVSDPRFGTLASDDPLDAETLLKAAGDGGFANLPAYGEKAGVLEMIESVRADTLVELTFTDLETGEPATTHVRRAIEAGLNVSTTNKGPIALNYGELRDLADAKGVALAFEGTVMSGSPAVELAMTIKDAGCSGALGILNGTTNYIITRMESGVSYDDALAEAQERGYAEADPAGDVEGHDAAGKLTILAQVLAAVAIPIGDVERVPLATVSPEDIAEAAKSGERWRYIGTLEERDGKWRASVSPKRLPATHPLAAITGATNAITFRTDLLGDVTVSGPGAGRSETAFAVISDLRRIERARRN
jgi:homoserine dehydrogenase